MLTAVTGSQSRINMKNLESIMYTNIGVCETPEFIVQQSFGDTGLSVKLKQRGARASFAARHKCSTKKDKTKAGYWSCNIGRYWKSLGGGSNFSGYW